MEDDIDVSIVPPTITSDSDAGEGAIARLDSLWEGRIETQNYPYVEIHANVDAGPDAIEDNADDLFTLYEAGEKQEIESIEMLTSALDLVFVFDDTGSMADQIDAAKRRVTNLTTAIEKRGIEARYGLVTFKDSTDVDTRLTDDAAELKQNVERLEAQGGGDAPECNFDAIETALSFDFRSDANQVFVDITDAPSHYRNDGSGYADYSIEDVARDLEAADVTFIAVSPGLADDRASVQTLANKVGGLWTDIHSTDFDNILDRIQLLLVSTFVLTYHTCTPPGAKRDVRVVYDDPDRGRAADSAPLKVPERFELPPECQDKITVPTETEFSTRVSRSLPAHGGKTTLEAEIRARQQTGDYPRHIVLCIDMGAIAGDDEMAEAIQSGIETLQSTLNEQDRLGLVTFDETRTNVHSPESPGEIPKAVHESLLAQMVGGTDSVLSSALDSARRQHRDIVRSEQTVDRIVLLTDGRGIREADDVSGYRLFARDIAADDITIDLGAIGTNPEIETIAALADARDGSIEHIDAPTKLDKFLREVIKKTTDISIPKPRLRVTPGAGFTTLATVDGDEEVHCRRTEGETVRQFVPPRTEDEPGIELTLPDLREGDELRVLIPMLGPRRSPGMAHHLADLRLVEGNGEEVATASASVPYLTGKSGKITEPDIEGRLIDSEVRAALAKHDIEKAKNAIESLDNSQEGLKRRLEGKITDIERDGVDGTLELRDSIQRIEDR